MYICNMHICIYVYRCLRTVHSAPDLTTQFVTEQRTRFLIKNSEKYICASEGCCVLHQHRNPQARLEDP
jgi:hypothetical protein